MEKIHGDFYYESAILPHAVRKLPGASVIIDEVRTHLTHNVVRYHDGLKRVCLNNFQGNKPTPFNKKFVKDMNDEDARDLEERTNGFLPSAEILMVRTLMRQLDIDPQFNRYPYLCDVCNEY